MSQDTRKDPRAKVLTMTVRYKSATLDEFIEHHSYDVSRGGMFIKTPSPFPPGTLLKFEVKIAADQKVIQGVGRVVWKRDSETHGDARPAGMGVKFIKIDDASRKVIDALVDSRGDATSAYEAGGGDGGPPAPAPTKAPGIAAEAPKVPNPRKATMIGLGAMNPSNRPPMNTPFEQPSASFFPETKSEAEMPAPEDRTVMKQARELLQDALAQTGSSLSDVASAPKHDAPPRPAAGTPSVAPESEAPSKPASKPPSELPLSATANASTPPEATPSTQRSEPPVESIPTAALATEAKAVSARPVPASAAPASGAPRERISARKSAVSAAPANRRVSVPVAAPVDKGSGSGRIVVIVAAIAAAAGIVFALSNGSAPAPAPSVSAEPAASLAPPVASEAPADTASAAPPAPVESAAPVAPVSAAPVAPVAPVSAAPVAPVVPAPAPKPVAAAAPRPAPVVVPRPVAVPPAPGEVIHRPFVPPVRPPLGAKPPSEPSSPPPSAPSEPSAPKPAEPAPPTAAPSAAPAPAAPKPKPVEPAGDNPY